MSLAAVRDAIDSCGELDTATFARRTRNAIAQAIVGEALVHNREPPPPHEPPVDELHRRLGDDLGDTLVAVYEGGDDWTSRAIDALPTLHELARE